MFNKEKMCAYNQELMDNFETYLSYEPYSPATVKHYVDDTRTVSYTHLTLPTNSRV